MLVAILIGDLVSGVDSVIGPFGDESIATAWGNEHLEDVDYAIIAITGAAEWVAGNEDPSAGGA